MNQAKINQGFVMCAGFGTRMRPLTDNKPKPMVEIDQKAMVDHILDDFQNHSITKAVINTHYQADILKNHLNKRSVPEIIISHEPKLLYTGGGLKNALHHFKDKDFFVSNGDSYLEHGAQKTALQRMESTWDNKTMDILLLLQPVDTMTLTEGIGDYDLDDQGRASRSHDKSGQYMFTSLRINTPNIFKDSPNEPFNYRDLMDKTQDQGRLYGLVHDGSWHHISTPNDVTAVNAYLDTKQGKTG